MTFEDMYVELWSAVWQRPPEDYYEVQDKERKFNREDHTWSDEEAIEEQHEEAVSEANHQAKFCNTGRI